MPITITGDGGISGLSIDSVDLANGTIQAEDIADGTITTAKIGDSQITDAKINGMATSKLSGTISNSQIADVATSKLTGTVSDAQIAGISSSKLSGALPAIDGSSLTGIDTSPPTTFNAVGTYSVGIWKGNLTAYGGGNLTTAGSNIVKRSGSYGTFVEINRSNGGSNPSGLSSAGTGLSGTWRNMSHTQVYYTSDSEGDYMSANPSIWVRIS